MNPRDTINYAGRNVYGGGNPYGASIEEKSRKATWLTRNDDNDDTNEIIE